MSPTTRSRTIVGGLALGLVATLPALALTGGSPASAATKTTVVTYERCDVRTTANNPATRVGPVFTWRPTITVDIATPVRTNEDVSGRVTISAFPANKIPVTIKDPYTYYTGMIATSLGGQMTYGKTLTDDDHVLGQPIQLGESEKDYWFAKAGVTNWFPDKFAMDVSGWDNGSPAAYHRFYVACDRPLTSPVLATIPAWDPAAKAAVTMSPGTVMQGRTTTLRGSGFRPDESVAFHVDGVRLTTKATSQIGAASHTWTAPAFMVPGKHTVKLTSTISAKTVSRTFVVTPAAAKATLKPSKVKRGKKTTVRGSLFKPGEKVAITVTRTSGGKGLRSKSIGTVTATTAGTVTKRFKVVKKFGKGKHRVTLTGRPSSRVATVTLTVKK